jgi:hypothetical protein
MNILGIDSVNLVEFVKITLLLIKAGQDCRARLVGKNSLNLKIV